MLLLDREPQRILERRSGSSTTSELQQKFSKKDARHHPIGFFFDAEMVVLDRIRTAALGDQRLGEAEPKHLVGRVAGHKRAELL